MKHQEGSKPSTEGVTIKTEPVIKTEPGTSSNPGIQRLPSLRPPRDLSLSAYSQKIPNLNQSKNKKVYVPNLNVQRNKPAESVTVKKEQIKPNLTPATERGRGRGKRALIQLNQGVFADGVPGAKRGVGRGRPGGGGGGDATDNVLKRPTLKLKENVKVDKKEEEDTVKQLLRDDFIDDPTLEPDFHNCPITLPMLNCSDEPGLKKKSDMKQVDKKENLSINDVFLDSPKPDPGFIFLQLPYTMPGLNPETQVEDTKPSAQASSTAQTEQATENKPENNRCLLTSMPGGQIGKLQILKSGRARLVLGNTKMWLEMGTQVAFKQEVVVTELDKESHSGHMVSLGPLNVRMVAMPDWEGMIAKLNITRATTSSKT